MNAKGGAGIIVSIGPGPARTMMRSCANLYLRRLAPATRNPIASGESAAIRNATSIAVHGRTARCRRTSSTEGGTDHGLLRQSISERGLLVVAQACLVA